MGINQNLFIASVNTNLAALQRAVGASNSTLAALLAEQRRANEFAEQQLAATRETNEHLTYLIRAFLRAGVISPQP